MALKRLVRAWMGLQVSHRGGTYSIERMLALNEFTTDTSLSAVMLVCVCTPLPMVALVFSLELVPLQDPLDGWDTNYGFWIRVFIMCAVISNGLAVQVKHLVEGVQISSRQFVLLSLCGAAAGSLAPLVVSVCVSFPVPFAVVTMCPPYFMLMIASFRVIVGSKVFCEILSRRKQLQRFLGFFCAQLTLVFVYPAYQALFEAAAHTEWQLFVVLLLPLIKLVLKYLTTLTVTHVEDMMPEAVIFTVDFFHAIYLATSMQSAASLTTVVAMMVIDLSQTAVSLISLHRRTASIMLRLHEALKVPEQERASLSLVTSVCLLSHNPGRLKLQTLDGVRICSPIRHRLTEQSRTLLEHLGQLKADVPCSKISNGGAVSLKAIGTASLVQHSTSRGCCKILREYPHRSTVSPTTHLKLVPVSSIPALDWKSRDAENFTQTQELFQEALAALFTSECLVLTEFLEFVIPMFYSVYVLVMVHLPSAQYHIELAGVTRDNVGPTVRTVFVYGLLEFASFVVLAVIMQRNCGMRALSHLAFVLRTQLEFVLSKMTLWMVVTLAFRIVHFGVDFTFQFDWATHREG